MAVRFNPATGRFEDDDQENGSSSVATQEASDGPVRFSPQSGRFETSSGTPSQQAGQQQKQEQIKPRTREDFDREFQQQQSQEEKPKEDKKPGFLERAKNFVVDTVSKVTTGKTVEENKQEAIRFETEYQSKLKDDIVAGTAVRKDRLVLNVEKARVDAQDKINQLRQNFNQVQDSKERSKTIEEIKSLEKQVFTYSKFLQRADDMPFLEQVVVSGQLPVAEQLNRAQKEAEAAYLARYDKALDPNDVPQGMWGNFKNKLNASTMNTLKSMTGVVEGVGSLIGAENLEEWANKKELEFKAVARSNPQWAASGDGVDDKVAGVIGSMIPNFITVIGAVAAAPFTEGASLAAIPALAGGQAALMGYGDAFQVAKDSGASDADAQKAATTAALASYYINKWADGVFFNRGVGEVVEAGAKAVATEATENAAQTALRSKIQEVAKVAGRSLAEQYVVQGAAGGAEQLSRNAVQRFYDEHADLFQDVVKTAIDSGNMGIAFGVLSSPVHLLKYKRAQVTDVDALEVGANLRENGLIPEYKESVTTTTVGPTDNVTLYRGTVADDSTRPIQQIGKSYSLNPEVTREFALEAAAKSGQEPLVVTARLKEGSKIVSLPDVYDARLIDPEDPRIKGADAVRLEQTLVKNGEAEVVVLNDDALEVVSQGGAKTALEAKTSQPVAQEVATDAPVVEDKPSIPSNNRTLSPQEPVGTEGNTPKQSRYFERVKEGLQQELESQGVRIEADSTYTPVRLVEDAQKAASFVESNPKEAVMVARGLRKPPEGVLTNGIALAVAEDARIRGDYQLMSEVEVATSLRATREGQEIAALRGSVDDSSPRFFMKQLLNARMESIAKGVGEEVGTKRKKPKAIMEIDKQAKALKKTVSKETLKLQEAQSLIDALTCK